MTQAGWYPDPAGQPQTYRYWDGTSWTQVPSPNKVSGENVLLDVDARSATDVWAVGYYGTTAGHKTLILHWNGSAWAVA